jgi:gamma-glutamyltranspeptidase/glutathione hydrolase
MAGVQVLHDRFGRLPFAALFGPAVWVADQGVAVGPMVANLLQAQGQFVTRLPEGGRVFAKKDGALYRQGEILRQAELAQTLQYVATQGAAYMYSGEWAQRFVDAIQREGGKMTLADLSAYRPEWTEPLRMPYRGYEVVSLGSPNIGGLHTLAALKLAEVANLKRQGSYATSPETLYSLIQISRLQRILAFAPRVALKEAFPDVDWSPASGVTAETAERLWAHIRRSDWQPECCDCSTWHLRRTIPQACLPSTNREMSLLFSTHATATAGDRQGSLWMVCPSLILRVFSSSRSRVPALVSACQTPRTR